VGTLKTAAAADHFSGSRVPFEVHGKAFDVDAYTLQMIMNAPAR